MGFDESSAFRERKFGDELARVKFAGAGLNPSHGEPAGREVDGIAAERGAERAGVDDDHAIGRAPHARPMGVADDDEVRRGAVAVGERSGEAGLDLPRAEDAEYPQRRPNGVSGEAERVFEAVWLRLVLLGHRCRHAPPDGESRLQWFAFRRRMAGQLRGDEAPDERGIAAPGHNVVEENVAVRDEHSAGGEIERVVRRDIRIVIAGQKRDGRSAIAHEGRHLGVFFRGELVARAPARVEGVAVEHEPGHALEQRAELPEPFRLAGTVAVVNVGENADKFGRHRRGAREAASRGGAMFLTGEACPPAAAMRRCRMRVWAFFFAGLWLAAPIRADQAADIARIHLEAIGGRERMATLTGLRISGYVLAGGKRVRFTMIAARPDRVRLETQNNGRTLVNASDGVEPPWEFDTGTWPPRYHEMSEVAAKAFTADAEFDDPLVAGEARGFVLEYGGEVMRNGQKLLRVLVTKKMRETFFVFVDPETYFIVLRTEERVATGGRKRQVATHYDDFRPVDGVLLPHRVTLETDGRVEQQMIMEKIETNPELSAETFTRPRAMVQPEK